MALATDSLLIHPMKFYDIYEDIAMELPTQPNLNIVRAELNKVIRRVNDEIGLWKEVIKVTPSGITQGVEGMSAANDFDLVEAETTQNLENFGRFRFDWSWSSTDNFLKLSDDVVELLEVYVDDVEWELVEYPKVKDSNNSEEKIWSQVGRYIFFPFDMSTSSKILKVRVKKSYPFITSTVNDPSLGDKNQLSIDLPESYRQLLVSGVLFALTNRGQYKDEDVFKVNKEIFDREFVALRDQYENLEKYGNVVFDVQYKY